jgi:hypothetical protein
MAGARFKDAMSDLAETIRRVFQAPPTHPVAVGCEEPGTERIAPLDATVLLPFVPVAAVTVTQELLRAAPPVAVPVTWTGTLGGEPGWATWASGATTCPVPVFQAEKCNRLGVPPLPRRAEARREKVGGMTTLARNGWRPFLSPRAGTSSPELGVPRVWRGMERVMGLPLAITGEDLGRMSKALWMRYTLQLVRATGENIRNLEVLGLYRIPVKGTRQVDHDPVTGRLLVTLNSEAVGARRAPFILARRKNDASIVCSFVEEA